MITFQNTVGQSSYSPKAIPDIRTLVLVELSRAREYAIECDCDVWEFAVEIEELRSLGATNSEFRWLIARGYARHRREMHVSSSGTRYFEPLGRNCFPIKTCFILTEPGLSGLNGRLGTQETRDGVLNAAHRPSHRLMDRQRAQAKHDHHRLQADLPRWDIQAKELRIGTQLVKQFRWPAPNQQILLTVFQEESWTRRIDDPLPQVAEIDPRRRLHDTIKCLNRNQVNPLVRFRGDGSGMGVTWERCKNDRTML